MGTPDKKTSIYGEIDYLWEAMEAAQEESSRVTRAYSANRLEGDALKSRVAHLEKAVAGGLKREASLKADIETLKTAIARDAGTLKEALAAAGTAARLQEAANELESRLAGNANILTLKEDQLGALRERLKGAAGRLAEKEKTIEALAFRIKGLAALPDLAAALRKESEAAGKEPAVFEDLVERLETLKAENEKTAGELAAAKTESVSLIERNQALAKERDRLVEETRGLALRTDTLAADMKAAQARFDFSEEEKAALRKELTALAGARDSLKAALEAGETGAAAAARNLAARDEEITRLKQTIFDTGIKLDEQKQNFAGAVKQIFEFQNSLASLRRNLKESRESGAELAKTLEERKADLEKLNAIIRENSLEFRQEREAGKRALGRIKVLEAEIEGLKAKLAKTEDYAARILKAVEERDNYITGLGKELEKTAALEQEVVELKRHNLKLTGRVREEQAGFMDKVVKNLAKTAGDLKLFNIRLSAEQKKHLSQPLKNLYSALNLMKAWQTYIDESAVETTDTDLRRLVSEAAAQWERAFKSKKLGFAAYLAAPSAMAGLNAEKIKTALYQLIKNAYENLPAGGSLKLVFELSRDKRSAVIKLDDTGPGLSDEIAGRLYTPFNTLKKDHIGIGLALAARVAELHGGTLTAANKKDRGLLVELALPLSDTHGQPPAK